MAAEVFLKAASRLTAGDFDGFAELLRPDVTTSGVEDWPEPGPFSGRDAVVAQFKRIVADFEAQRFSDFEVVAEDGDWSVLAYRWHVRGVGSQVETHFDFAVAVRVNDGHLAEMHFRRTPDAARAAAGMRAIRPCRADDRDAIVAIVNAAAEAYRGVIPADRWHDPYMPPEELDAEIAAGVEFWGYAAPGGELVGIMGIQPVRDVHLIRHAYVSPERQRGGVGGALLEQLAGSIEGRILVGTWAAAGWAIDFYRRHDFEQVSVERKTELLKSYWSIPERQIETSVVLARPAFEVSI
jgi:ketosteroid isomerase-like protein/N-acetylglutamate synthase-like GNAT family acetyltransferase